MTALASHQCGPGSNPGVNAICGLSLLLVLSCAARRFSPDTPFFPSRLKSQHFQISISTRNTNRITTVCMCYLQIVIYVCIYFFVSVFVALLKSIKCKRLCKFLLTPSPMWFCYNLKRWSKYFL